MAEFYIRAPGSEESRGPFNEDKLTSLAEAGQLTLETHYYDEAKGGWLPIGENESLKAMVFPERRKLGLRKDGVVTSAPMLNKPEDAAAPAITVGQMLAAAEGDTKQARASREKRAKEEKAAAMALPMLGVMMILSGLSNCIPRYQVLVDVFTKYDWPLLLQEPFAVVGLLDLFLALCLFLNVNTIFPIVRFRAMVGLGYFCYYYWSLDDGIGLIASACAGLGLFICTLTLNLYAMIVFAAAGVLGMGILAWLAWAGAAASAAASG